MPSLLMCLPQYYAIEYEINPWMHLDHPADRKRAAAQWRQLYDTLTGLPGVKVELVAPEPGSPDMTFTANAGLVVNGGVILSKFRHRERRAEELHFERWFRDRGYTVRQPTGHYAFEGEGDALWLGKTLVVGYGFRTEPSAPPLLAWALSGVSLVAVELADPRFYHLDTCFMPLHGNAALWYPQGFTRAAGAEVERLVSDLILVPEEEAVRFACNAIVIDRTVILNRGCPTVEAALTARGYTPVPLELDEFIKAGGSAKCLALFLER